jgi:preprotein translocase subunit SecA
MKFRLSDLVQRPFNFAVVDEVDSILIDEARTPLIISGPSEGSTDLYQKADAVVRRFEPEKHFKIDEKSRAVSLLEEGVAAAEKALHVVNLFDLAQMDLVHGINQALKAHFIFKRDVDYMVKDGQVIIVDEFTGRLMPGRRYSDGLHQALEAKEKVKIEQENQTLASITFQNYFRMYKKLSGMTGTASTEAEEFAHIYGLDVVEIPTNKPLIRIENPDVIYRTAEEKWEAVQNEIVELNASGRPVLVGTTSIEKSELVSTKLRRKGVKHVVLNAKYHEQEAGIIAQAGRAGAVTIATNMAGRGVDILLGGNYEVIARETLRRQGVDLAKITPEQLENAQIDAKKAISEEHDRIVALGGLHILGTERHEARRIDNQLRGRAGRQGDPGSSRFYLSLEDDLMRIFGSDRIKGLMARIGMGEGVPIEHAMVSKAIQRSQKQVEGHNFTIRKHLLEYDDVMNKQRTTVYAQRKEILEGKDMKEYVGTLVEQILDWQLDTHVSAEKSQDEWDLEGFRNALAGQFGVDPGGIGIDWAAVSPADLKDRILTHLRKVYEDKERLMGPGMMRQFERFILLQIIDNQWKDHLLGMDYLKEGIGLRGYGQRDPLVEYKKESFDMFQAMLDRIEDETVRYLYLLQPAVEQELARKPERPVYRQGSPASTAGGAPKTAARAMIPKKRKK